MVMSVYAPDPKKSLEMCEECIADVITVLRECRKGGALDLTLQETSMQNWVWCIRLKTKLYGPLCWQGCDKDLGGFKKFMWYGIMKEFGCKVSCTWSACGKVRAEAFAHRHLGKDRKEELSQLDLSHFREKRRRTTCQSLSEKEHKMDGMEADNRRAERMHRRIKKL